MKRYQIIALVSVGFLFSVSLGFVLAIIAHSSLMGKYDLYQCIYNNADDNNFNPYLIQQVEDECICFREYNYTNLLNVNCSSFEARVKK